MATPTYEQITAFSGVSRKLVQAAIKEFMKLHYADMSVEDVIQLMAAVGQKYGLLGGELGAQWYDLCSRLANIEVEPAELQQPADEGALKTRAGWYLTHSTSSDEAIANFLHNVITESIRETGNANLWRDYTRGLVAGRWARVPVGDTCAWCLMLASQGAWYVSEESALGKESGHYHDGCDCVAVYHANPDNIPNYPQLTRYKEMYYNAENAREANRAGTKPYSDELQKRVDDARERHRRMYENGETDKEWTVWNETLIVMRYQNGLK